MYGYRPRETRLYKVFHFLSGLFLAFRKLLLSSNNSSSLTGVLTFLPSQLLDFSSYLDWRRSNQRILSLNNPLATNPCPYQPLNLTNGSLALATTPLSHRCRDAASSFNASLCILLIRILFSPSPSLSVSPTFHPSLPHPWHHCPYPHLLYPIFLRIPTSLSPSLSISPSPSPLPHLCPFPNPV